MEQLIDAILLCGGKGTRFREVTEDKVPKSLYRLNGEELIQFTINNLDFSFIHSLIFAVDHHADSIKDWVLAQNFPCPVFFSYQTEPGVLGAVSAATKYVKQDNFIICNTDELRKGLSLKKVLDDHFRTQAHSTMTTTRSDCLFHHRVIEANKAGVIQATELKNPEYQNDEAIVKQINAGLIVFNKECIKFFDEARGNDWNSIIDPLVEKGFMYASLNSNIRYFNVGTQYELDQARTFLYKESGSA